MKKKEYIRPESAFITLGDELMDLGGVSVIDKNEDGHNVFLDVDGEGDLIDARSKFINIWDDDLEETEDEW